MAKQAKSQEKKATVATKSQGSVKGNSLPKKTWVTMYSKSEGFKSVELETCRGNYPPANTGDREKDAENMRSYRESYRADLKRLAHQAPPKPRTLFDLYQIKNPVDGFKHPRALAQALVRSCKWGINIAAGKKELLILSTSNKGAN